MRNNYFLIKPGSRADRFLKKQFSSKLFSYNEIFTMLIPLILDQYFINAISLLTTAMISSSSQESVTAVSLVNPLAMMIYSVFSAISVGGTVVVAQYKGRGSEEKIRKTAGQVVTAAFLVAITSCIILVLCSDGLIRLMFGAADPVVIKKAHDYLIGIAISQIFLAIYMSAFGVFRGMGASKICLRLTIIINLLHLSASMVFLNIMHLDILGTALSLNIARLTGSIIAVGLLIYPKSVLHIRPRHIFHLDLSILKSIFKYSIPFTLEQLFFNFGSILVQGYMVQLGTVSIAANAIANSAFSILYSAGAAVSALSTTVIGQCTGTGDKALTRKYGKKMIWLGTAISFLSIIMLFPLMPVILKLYHAPSETISTIYTLLIIAVIPMPFFWSPSNVTPCVLRSAGDSIFSSIVSLITMWLVRVGLGYIFAVTLSFGVAGVWICMGIEWGVRTLIFTLRFRSDAWMMNETVE